MSLSIQFYGSEDGSDGPFELCSATDWHHFGEFIGELPGLQSLKVLLQQGSVMDTVELATDLTQLSDTHALSQENTVVVERLMEVVGGGDTNETAEVLS